ncbi:MAG: hypothetical protein ACREQ5_15245 [Candidatus Dormibacteria bacterium]
MPDAQTFADINQGTPPSLFSSLIQAWGLGSLGNMQVQRIAQTDKPSLNEVEVQARPPLGTQTDLASPSMRLRAMKAARFTATDRLERIQRSLQALNQPIGINLSPEEWASVASQIEDDEE